MVLPTTAFFFFILLQVFTYWAAFYVIKLLIKSARKRGTLGNALVAFFLLLLLGINFLSLFLLMSGRLVPLIAFSLAVLIPVTSLLLQGNHKGG